MYNQKIVFVPENVLNMDNHTESLAIPQIACKLSRFENNNNAKCHLCACLPHRTGIEVISSYLFGSFWHFFTANQYSTLCLLWHFAVRGGHSVYLLVRWGSSWAEGRLFWEIFCKSECMCEFSGDRAGVVTCVFLYARWSAAMFGQAPLWPTINRPLSSASSGYVWL